MDIVKTFILKTMAIFNFKKIKDIVYKVIIEIFVSLGMGFGLYNLIGFMIRCFSWRYYFNTQISYKFFGIVFYKIIYKDKLTYSNDNVNILIPTLIFSVISLFILLTIEWIIRRKNETK